MPKISDCCASHVVEIDDRNICSHCGEPCEAREDEELSEPFRFYGLTSRARAGMSRESNGDLYVND